ncbi:M14 family zinc carboxypeptidase [Actinoalloteichus hoggarensis]|uniref:Carboxypeptidase T n=1 Tax=Actinoalloteichus hoggarensis TaxID=1470176 RepID=A0A221W9Q8_9PSEU|nr:M14 family zinc carboxypeptidase [Actinoalloteichus hoggarensis]ASO22798.1 Carboxypeptidase T precursor [Actinoalloteichus hoggarensis]
MLTARQRQRIGPLLLAAAVALTSTPAAVAAADLAVPAGVEDQMLLHRIPVGDQPHAVLAERLTREGFEVVGREGDHLVVLGDADTRDELAEAGEEPVRSDPAAPTVLPAEAGGHPLPDRLAGREYPTFYGGYRTVAGHQRFAADVAAAYPDLVRKVEYGDSWRRQQDWRTGHRLTALCITADAGENCALNPDTPRPRLLLLAQVHARELTTSELAWRFVTELLDGHTRDAEITTLLADTEIWVVPQVNPDGVTVVEEGIAEVGLGASSPAWQRKNVDDANNVVECGTGGSWSSDHDGIDLNRNWDTRWGGVGTNPNPCAQTYPGPRGNSEPETARLATLIEALFHDQRGPGEDDAAPPTTTGTMITLHSTGDLVLFPWGHDATQQAPNDAGLRSLGFRLSHFNGYTTGQPPEVLYGVTGATDDWTYDTLGIASYTFEIGSSASGCPGFHAAYSCQDMFWELNRDALLYAAKTARQPYALSLGPTVSEVTSIRALGRWASVHATAADDAYGEAGVGRPAAQDVVAAEVYLGAPPWAGGTPQPIRVQGAGTEVSVGGVISTAGLPAGRHPVHVRAQDADGDWGPITSAWLAGP